jgi:hypothetical protein
VLTIDTIAVRRLRCVREGAVPLAEVTVLVGSHNAGRSAVIEAMCWPALCGGAPVVPGSALWYRRDTTSTVEVDFQLGQGRAALRIAGGKGATVLYDDDAARAFLEQVLSFGPEHGLDPSIERGLWAGLLPDRRDKALVADVRDVWGLGVEGIGLLPEGGAVLMSARRSMPLDAQGHGVRRGLRCLMVLASMARTALVIEEPELHQAPEPLRRLARVVCNRARAQRVQLVVSTHSLEAARAFLAGARAAGSASAVGHLSLDGGRLHAVSLDGETATSLDATELDLRELARYASSSRAPNAKSRPRVPPRYRVFGESEVERAVLRQLGHAGWLPAALEVAHPRSELWNDRDAMISRGVVPHLRAGLCPAIVRNVDAGGVNAVSEWAAARLAAEGVPLRRAFRPEPRVGALELALDGATRHAVVVSVGLLDDPRLVQDGVERFSIDDYLWLIVRDPAWGRQVGDPLGHGGGLEVLDRTLALLRNQGMVLRDARRLCQLFSGLSGIDVRPSAILERLIEQARPSGAAPAVLQPFVHDLVAAVAALEARGAW